MKLAQAFGNPFGNPYLLLTLTTMMWGGNSVAGKLATFDWQPFTITSIRWLLTALVLLPFAWQHLKDDWHVLKSNWQIIAALGAFGMALFNLCTVSYTHLTLPTIYSV